jgi:hypothetical protein
MQAAHLVSNLPTGPKKPTSTVLAIKEAAMVVAFLGHVPAPRRLPYAHRATILQAHAETANARTGLGHDGMESQGQIEQCHLASLCRAIPAARVSFGCLSLDNWDSLSPDNWYTVRW